MVAGKNLFAEELSGREVIGSDGTSIGKVEGVAIDPNTWRVTSLHVKLHGNIAEQFDVKKRFESTSIQVSVEHIQMVSDTVLLRSPVADLFKPVGPSKEVTEEGQRQQQPSGMMAEEQEPQATTTTPNP
jgi:sporulation protein YlmC with PRC-barrel domain